MMRYAIVKNANIYDLTGEVQAMINEGWVPLGGVTVAVSLRDDCVYAQALIKQKDQEEEDDQ